MANREIEKYYEMSGREHIISSEWISGCYVIFVDGVFYANADDRLERREIINDLTKDKMWFEERPKQKTTPPVPASR